MSSTGFITRSNACALSNKPDRTEEERSPSFQPLLESLMNDHYRLYEIENRDKPNVLYRALISLCELGATREQLVAAYCDILPDLAPLQSTVSSNITEDKWREHLGDSSSYSGYLAFFGDQIRANGTDATVHRYFFEGKLYVSIGSHLQPLVHLAFGLEHDLPPLIAQGLAYLASSYSDISDMLYCTNSSIISTENNEEEEKVLFDLVASDPRFNGKMESSLTSSQASKRLLKTHKLLLTTYIKRPQLSLERLTRLAASFLVAEGCKKSLAGVQLLESALAIQTLCSLYGERSDELLQVQYLATLCTYVLLDRPSNAILQTHNNSRDNSSAGAGDWKACTVAILDQGDIPSILALKALLKAHSLYDKDPIYYNVAKALEQSEGRWRRL